MRRGLTLGPASYRPLGVASRFGRRHRRCRGRECRVPWVRRTGLADVASELRAGTMSADAIPITAFEHGGQLVSINNRGLAALSDAGLVPTNLTIVGRNSVDRSIMSRLDEVPSALGTGLPSSSIAVTPSMSDWSVLRVSSVPGAR